MGKSTTGEIQKKVSSRTLTKKDRFESFAHWISRKIMCGVFENTVTTTIWQWSQNIWDKRDKKVDGWPLMSSPFPTIIFISMYVVISTKIGPMLMKSRKAFNLRKVIVVYNLCMMVLNGYLLYQIWTLAWGNDYSWICESLDRSLNPRSLKIAGCMWLYFMCKYLDWLDTLFFILKKKVNHLSALHVYHHTLMPWLGWFGTRIMPGGQPTFAILLNCGIHVIMHCYYCLAALGPSYQKYLWWKKYLTVLQMIQFVVILLHGVQVFWYNCNIDVPHEWGYPLIPIPLSLFYMFAKFYRQNYDRKQILHPDKINNKNQ